MDSNWVIYVRTKSGFDKGFDFNEYFKITYVNTEEKDKQFLGPINVKREDKSKTFREYERYEISKYITRNIENLYEFVWYVKYPQQSKPTPLEKTILEEKMVDFLDKEVNLELYVIPKSKKVNKKKQRSINQPLYLPENQRIEKKRISNFDFSNSENKYCQSGTDNTMNIESSKRITVPGAQNPQIYPEKLLLKQKTGHLKNSRKKVFIFLKE